MAFWKKQEPAEPPSGVPVTPPSSSAQAVSPIIETAPPPPEPKHEEGTRMSLTRHDDLTTTPTSSGDLLLGHGAEFEGKLTFAGTVRMDAKFKGSIFTDDVLVVGEHAVMEADITCGTVIVHGEVVGNIRAKVAVELRKPAKVRGDIESPTLSIEKGVVFQGRSSTPGAPRAAASNGAGGTQAKIAS